MGSSSVEIGLTEEGADPNSTGWNNEGIIAILISVNRADGNPVGSRILIDDAAILIGDFFTAESIALDENTSVWNRSETIEFDASFDSRATVVFYHLDIRVGATDRSKATIVDVGDAVVVLIRPSGTVVIPVRDDEVIHHCAWQREGILQDGIRSSADGPGWTRLSGIAHEAEAAGAVAYVNTRNHGFKE